MNEGSVTNEEIAEKALGNIGWKVPRRTVASIKSQGATYKAAVLDLIRGEEARDKAHRLDLDAAVAAVTAL